MGVPDHDGGSGLSFICNLQATVEEKGWESGNYSNNEWGRSMFNDSNITNVAWGVLLTSVLLTCRGVLITHAPPNAVSATTFFVAVFKKIFGAT